MKRKDLKIGEIYWEQFDVAIKDKPWAIFIYNGSSINTSVASFFIGENYFSEYYDNRRPINTRLATQEEKAWLKACIEANKFIPKDQVKSKVTRFKKDDYIVCLEGDFTSRANSASGVTKRNYCVKQRENCDYLNVYIGLEKGIHFNEDFTFNKHNKLKDWRYATQTEIDHYNKIAKPYDVTSLNKPEYLNPEDLVEGQWYKFKEYGERYEWIFKFKALYDKGFKTYKHICTDYTFKSISDKALSNTNKNNKFLNIDLEEVYKYFPEEKPYLSEFDLALEECKKRYPVGTKFHPVNKNYPLGDTSTSYIIEGNDFKEWKSASYSQEEAIAEENSAGILWYKGKFAPIVNEKHDKEVVHCKTQEEFNFVAKQCKFIFGDHAYKSKKPDCCIKIKSNEAYDLGMFDSLAYYREQPNTKIISFEDWCEENRYAEFSVYPKYQPRSFIDFATDYLINVSLPTRNSGKTMIQDYLSILHTSDNIHAFSQKNNKLEIFIDPPTPIKVEPIIELKLKQVNKLTIK